MGLRVNPFPGILIPSSDGGGGGPITSTDITDSTTAGRALLTAADAEAQADLLAPFIPVPDAVLTPTFAYDGDQVLQMVIGNIPNGWRMGDGGTQSGLIIGNSVTSIGDAAFESCTGFAGTLTIPDSVTSIGGYAFYDCPSFTGNLTIGSSVTTIGSGAFYDCSSFTGNLTIPNSVTTIGSYAFCKCSGFTGNLTIGDSVTTIENGAFDGCSGFTGNLTIPDSVTSIGSESFYACSSFTGNLTIPNSVTSIGSRAFYDCLGLTNVNCYVTRTIMNATSCLDGTGVTTINVPASGSVSDTWTAGADTIGGKDVTIIKSL
jgi:hypothetical protein